MYALQLKGITKDFSGVLALDDVSMNVEVASVHALMGENGAGKSTLIKALSGAQAQSKGEIYLDGLKLDIGDTPLQRMEQGIITIYQELSLLENLTVSENMYLGREPTRKGLVDYKKMDEMTRLALDKVKLFDINPKALLSNYNVAQRQMIEIARALTFKAKVIVMDEPSSSLSEKEESTLHEMVRFLKSHAISVVYVTHRLSEIFKVCDHFTVLRDGKFSGEGELTGKCEDDIIKLMVGRSVSTKRLTTKVNTKNEDSALLEIQHLSTETGYPKLKDINLKIYRGEILGLSGLVGAGRSKLARCIYGDHPYEHGSIKLKGKELKLTHPKDALINGVALLTEDRKKDGLFLDHSIKFNLTLPIIDRFLKGKLRLVDNSKERLFVQRYEKELAIKMTSIDTQVQYLSGGNQQKVLIARVLASSPELLIVDEPTRGVDVGSKAEIHKILQTMAKKNNIAILVISSELPEIMGISDRIVTMVGGQISGEILGHRATEENLMQLMTH